MNTGTFLQNCQPWILFDLSEDQQPKVISPPKTGGLVLSPKFPVFMLDWKIDFSLWPPHLHSLQLAHSFFEEKPKLLFWFLSFSCSWSEGPLSWQIRRGEPISWATWPGPSAFRYLLVPLVTGYFTRRMHEPEGKVSWPLEHSRLKAHLGEDTGLQKALQKMFSNMRTSHPATHEAVVGQLWWAFWKG